MGRWIKKGGVLNQTLESLVQNKSLIRCCPNIYLPNNDNKDNMEINIYFIVLTEIFRYLANKILAVF